MERRRFLQLASASTLAAVAGCLGGAGDTGTLATRVSDQPGDIGDFESCVVTVAEIRVKPSDAEGTATGEDEGLETIDAGGATADLVDLQGDASELAAEGELDTGDYDWLRLVDDGVDATLDGGGDATVDTPGEAPLKFDRSFEIRADITTTFTADFTPVKQGQSGGYVIQPVADEVTVAYEDESTATST
jgi:hypothetical protein